MSAELMFPRLYADLSGGSRFGSVRIPVTLQNFAPPASAFSVSPLTPATQAGVPQHSPLSDDLRTASTLDHVDQRRFAKLVHAIHGKSVPYLGKVNANRYPPELPERLNPVPLGWLAGCCLPEALEDIPSI